MSKIDKLSIQGIRSFSASYAETISFGTPLTLIVGFNGSGKTTIIECLRYATTGELPPNSKGGAFIHDPSLTGEKEVRAQVRLAFRTTVGELATVSRNMLLTVKKGSTRSMATKDCSLTTRNNGERNNVSDKVAAINEEVPLRLGVSQAVLDAVIFCHQDESLWPMSEPTALKKRFDEIFEAQRYTKAIDQLKIIRKKQGEMLASHKVQMGLHKSAKEMGEKNEKLRQKLEREIAGSREKFEELTTEMKALLDQVTEKRRQANTHFSIVENLRAKNDRFQWKSESANQLRERIIEEMAESEEELEKILAEYDQQLAKIGEERTQKTTQYREVQADIQQKRREHTAKVAEKGKHQSDKDKYERSQATRNAKILEAAQRHEVWGYSGELDDDQIKAFSDRIQKMLAEKRREVERVQNETAEDVEKAMTEINDLLSKKKALSHNRASARARVIKIDKEVSTLQDRLKNLDVDETLETVLQADMKELDTQLEQLRTGGKDVELDKQIREESDNLDRLEIENKRLTRELVDSSKLSDNNALLELRARELVESKRNLKTTIETKKSTLTANLGSQWTPESIESDYQAAFKIHSTAVDDALSKRASAKQKLDQLEYRLSKTRENLRGLIQDRDRCKKTVTDATARAKNTDSAAIDEYETELNSNEAEVTDLETQIVLFDKWKSFFEKADSAVHRSNKCYLCERDFKSDEAGKSKLLKKIAKKLNDDDKQELIEDKSAAEERVKVLLPVRKQYDTYMRLVKEIPPLEDDIRIMESEKKTLIRDLEEEDRAFKLAENKRNEVEAVQKTVMKIAELLKSISQMEDKINTIASQQSSSVAVRSAAEIEDAQERCSEQITSARTKLKKLESDRHALIASINKLELERSNLKTKLSTAARELQQKKNLQEQIQAKKTECKGEEDAMKEAEQEIEDIEPLISVANTNREEKAQRARSIVKRVADERDKIADTVNDLRKIESDIQHYLDCDGPAKLASNLRAIASLEETITNLEKEQQELTGRLNQLKERVDQADRQRENIRDNLDLRKLVRELTELKTEISELKSRNAQEDYDRLSAEAEKLEIDRTRRNAEREKITGIMSTKQQEHDRLAEEFAQEYEGAKAKYREAHVKVVATQAAIMDLHDYAVALDKAVMQYHTLKMEEINRTIAELWQDTYQGTDIDTILIRSDAETSTTSKKNYNYRVCMLKGDTEMDMRGRCSAGQKVLASIIIRLALAESFGVSCGLIALDEPTTNLDSDNIKSLAHSLHTIIEQRSAQKNLQLIVITHDEEFLKHMQVSHFCDEFYRIKRDEDQNSVISRENITEIMEG